MSVQPAATHSGIASYAAVLSRLSGVRWLRRENTAIARCPVHNDSNPSLGLWIGRRRQLMARCWGCSAQFAAIVRAVGLPQSVWYADGDRRRVVQRRIVAHYAYLDEHGEIMYEVVRYCPKDFRQRRMENGNWVWNMDGVRRVLYHLPDLLKADQRRMVLIPEGEADCEALATRGFVATCNVGGAGKWLPSYSQCLAGRHVCLLPDKDDAGFAHTAMVAGSLMTFGAATIRVVVLPGVCKDVSDFFRAGGTVDELKRVVYGFGIWRKT